MSIQTPTTASPRAREAAFADEFDRLFALAQRAARSRGCDRESANDVAQETLTRAYASWGKIASESYLDAWVVRVANNVAIDSFRRTARTTLSNQVDDRAQHRDHTDRYALEHALQRLPRRQREVVVLRYLDDLGEEEVARTLGCSVGTVRQSADRGRRKLAEILGDIDFTALQAPAEAAVLDPHTREQVVERGVMLRAARRSARIVTAGVIAIMVAIGGYLWVSQSKGSTPRNANQSTITSVPRSTAPSPTSIPTTSATSALTVPATTAASGTDVAAGVNPDLFTQIDRYFSVDVRRVSGSSNTPSEFAIVITNQSGRTIDESEFAGGRCAASVVGETGEYTTNVLGCGALAAIAPGETRSFNTGPTAIPSRTYRAFISVWAGPLFAPNPSDSEASSAWRQS